MSLLQNPELIFDVDAVLRGQGADPAVLRRRSPALVLVAEKAMQEGLALLQPQVYVSEFAVEAVRHERLLLGESRYLEGSLVLQHLMKARKVHAMLCSIGDRLEKRVSDYLPTDMVYALALDGVGSAAVEALAGGACHRLEEQLAAEGMHASIPLSPGMVGWPVEQGQPQIFRLFEAEHIGVQLNSSFVMTPRKSLSMVVGSGPEMEAAGRACDYCNMRETCRYQDHYSPLS
jgi:hypothetical protein